MVMEPVPATATDVFSHHLSRDSEIKMTMVVRIPHRVDRSVLTDAVSAVMDAEPILRSYLRHEDDWLSWHHDPEMSASQIVKEHESHDGDDDRFCLGALGVHSPPLWEVNLAHGDEDTVAISMSHALGDGKALMYLSDLVLRVYAGDPAPSRATSIPERSLDKLAKPEVAIGDSFLMNGVSAWPSLYVSRGMKKGRLVKRTLGAKQFAAARSAWKSAEGATVNDLLLASLALSLRDLTGKSDDAVVSATADLRRYAVDKVPDIANFSSNYAIGLGDLKDAEMKDAVRTVKTEMDRLKKADELGIEDLEMFRRINTMGQMDSLIESLYSLDELDKALYFVTNTGNIVWSPAVIDSLGPTKAYIAYPGIRPPTLGVVCSSHAGELNINLGHYEGLMEGRADELLDRMIGHICSI